MFGTLRVNFDRASRLSLDVSPNPVQETLRVNWNAPARPDARLRLLDPERFPDFGAFVEEEKHYEPIAQVVEDLLENARTVVRAIVRAKPPNVGELA